MVPNNVLRCKYLPELHSVGVYHTDEILLPREKFEKFIGILSLRYKILEEFNEVLYKDLVDITRTCSYHKTPCACCSSYITFSSLWNKFFQLTGTLQINCIKILKNLILKGYSWWHFSPICLLHLLFIGFIAQISHYWNFKT